MAQLLLELFSEEIPARMQARAAEDLKRLVTDGLAADGLAFESADCFATPRRLALCVEGLPKRQPDIREERKGPKVGAPDKAIAGFLRGAGLDSLEQCEKRDTPKGEVWFAVIEKPGQDTAAVLPDILTAAIRRLAWPKSMRWASNGFRWVRPLHAILAAFDGVALPGALELDGESVRFGNRTWGHRFLHPNYIAATNFREYADGLRSPGHVILDAAERRQMIAARLEVLAKKAKLAVRDDPALLDEVTGLVEWPVVLLGSIDKNFMDLPPEVLTTAMRSHQKYFALLDTDGALAPRFAVIANMEAKDDGAQIVAGNERVLRARLADARFFWDQDRKATLSSRTTQLADITFHAKLGTLDEKVDRVQALAVEIAKLIPNADRDRVRAAARLAKADLVTGMVGEFPELQGLMGRYYALADGEHGEVADAIRDHYAPQGPNDACPSAPVSVALALADRIDTLVGFWVIEEKPTGSKDPYALRRAALGVIRLIVENGLRLGLLPVFGVAFRNLAAGVTGGVQQAAICGDLLAFFAERLKVHLRGEGVRHDLIAAVFSPVRAAMAEDDLFRLIEKVKILAEFLATEDGANLLVAYRRAANIVRAEQRKGWADDTKPVQDSLFQQPEEKKVWGVLSKIDAARENVYEIEEFRAYLTQLSQLRAPIDSFFDNVTVNADDATLRSNRLKLLNEIRLTMDAVADFSQIEG